MFHLEKTGKLYVRSTIQQMCMKVLTHFGNAQKSYHALWIFSFWSKEQPSFNPQVREVELTSFIFIYHLSTILLPTINPRVPQPATGCKIPNLDNDVLNVQSGRGAQIWK